MCLAGMTYYIQILPIVTKTDYVCMVQSMKMKNVKATRHVVILVHPYSTLLSTSAPIEVFQNAIDNMGWLQNGVNFSYALHVVSALASTTIAMNPGITINCECSYREIEYPIDTLIVIGAYRKIDGAFFKTPGEPNPIQYDAGVSKGRSSTDKKGHQLDLRPPTGRHYGRKVSRIIVNEPPEFCTGLCA